MCVSTTTAKQAAPKICKLRQTLIDGLGFRPGHFIFYSVMLRLRRKPPEGAPNINSGKPWSAMDLADLEELLSSGVSAREIADYLCRDVDEVERKIASSR